MYLNYTCSAARLSQAFTSTRDGVHIQAAKVERIPDVMRNGHNFSESVLVAPRYHTVADRPA